jgi:eukaryotic-like serine/threonine-protein kinase
MRLHAGNVVSGRYRLIGEIGRGGMATVWHAHALRLDASCAIKFLSETDAADPRLRARFMQEARAAARLRSPHVVSVFDVDEWQGQPFIVMELLGGESLAKRLDRAGPLSVKLTCEVIRQAAAGLQKVHEAKLIHRDVKPDNLILESEDPPTVKLLDFGVAKHAGSLSAVGTASGIVFGTPHYMSPEQTDSSAELDHRSDLWSLAVVAFECLTGRRPFSSDSLPGLLLQVAHGPLPSLCALRPDLPEAAELWWRSAASRDRELRPQSALALAETLRAALRGTESSLRSQRSSRRAGRASAWRGGATWGLMLAAAFAGASYYVLRMPPPNISPQAQADASSAQLDSTPTTGADARTGEAAPEPGGALLVPAAALAPAAVFGSPIAPSSDERAPDEQPRAAQTVFVATREKQLSASQDARREQRASRRDRSRAKRARGDVGRAMAPRPGRKPGQTLDDWLGF